eukprot:TRINITY_DN22669_c0_g1_i1.p1 TRINITY_DN22669_c0_g1~~TRINITY_DN22669_c0_g1_i1.p1  ORF type:complete len:200 (-),score=55.44 TRINITY_DN22669_c0_g1_i1:88-687(-)
MAGTAGAIVGARRSRMAGAGDGYVKDKQQALDQLQMDKMPMVTVFDQKKPHSSQEVLVPRMYRTGAESYSTVTRDAVQKWLSKQLKSTVTDVGFLQTDKDGKSTSQLVFLSEGDVQELFEKEAPFRAGGRVVVCCDGDKPDHGVAAQLQDVGLFTSAFAGRKQSAEGVGDCKEAWASAQSEPAPGSKGSRRKSSACAVM